MTPILSIEEQESVEYALSLLDRKCEQHEFTSCGLAKSFFSLKLKWNQQEVFSVAFLDKQNILIEYSELFKGGIDGSTVDVRVIMKKALLLNSCAMLIAHNHPSGNVTPSSADREITKRIKGACECLNISLLDHIIVGEGTYSFAEWGDL